MLVHAHTQLRLDSCVFLTDIFGGELSTFALEGKFAVPSKLTVVTVVT